MTSGPGRPPRRDLQDRAMLRQAFDRSPVATLLLAPDDLSIEDANAAAGRFLGCRREELLNCSFRETVVEPARATLEAVVAQLRDGGVDSFEIEQRFRRADGRGPLGLVHLVPLYDEDGAVDRLYIQIVDVTEAREREVRHAQDLGDAVWLGRIRAALEEDRLMLYAQPIVDLTTGATIQQELLLRMIAEDGSVIAPGEFLPVAERYGLIGEIDRWVIRQAVSIAAEGQPSEFNLSGGSLSDPGILDELATAIRESGVDPARLVVEVTETAFGGAPDAGRRFADAVTALGCRLALDDFGIGFNSLSHLKHLPADHLKIDIEFVRELTSSDTDVRVVRGIVGLAREFDQTTIAEGVEDEATLLRLRELGVDYAQGFLLGRPAPIRLRPAGSDPLITIEGDDPDLAARRVAIVREVMERFAARDVDGLLELYHPELTIRTLRTGELADRDAPYRGHDGLRLFMKDVARVWDELILTPLSYRPGGRSVFVFGRAEGRAGQLTPLSGVLWIFRFEGELVESLNGFRSEAGTEALTPRQVARLAAVPAR